MMMANNGNAAFIGAYHTRAARRAPRRCGPGIRPGLPLPIAPETGQNGAMSEIAIRAAQPADAGPIARIDVETWRTTYPGMLSDTFLTGLSPRRREPGWAGVIRREPRDVRVAVAADGEILGFGSCGACRGEPGFTGEVFTLYVAPDWQNQGIGRRLLLALFSRLVASGRNAVIIWVLRDNPARFFYQRVGGTQVSHKMLPFGGGHVAAQAYGWRDLPNFLASLRADRAPEP